MQKEYKFQLEEAIEIPNWADAYPEHKFSVYKCCFLSTKPNSHEIPITDEVLRKCAQSILGNFLTAKIEGFDCSTHRKDENIMGYFPKEQEIEFVEEDGVTKAYAYAVVSKKYAEQFNNIFEFDNFRNSSVEMTVTSDDDTGEVISFDIYCLTVLGKRVAGSCPDADIKMVRFSQKKAEAYFAKNDGIDALKQFVQERKQFMADKTYKIDKSKEAMSEADWGEVDKAAMRDKIMDASNRAELVKAVYALVEDGWEDAPSEHLKYPIMQLVGDTFVYNRYALAFALAYAKQHNEEAVINKVEKIYEELDIDDSEGKEEKKMSEIEFSAVDISNLWCRLWDVIDNSRHWEYSIKGIYEEDGQKFAILEDREHKLYRLDFSLTEDGIEAAEEVVEVKQEFIETDNMQKFAEPENVADYRFAEDEPKPEEDKHEDDHDELMARIAQLEADIADRDNIIMGCNAELEELRQFKADVEEKEKVMSVEAIMSEVKEFIDEKQFAEMREQGMACGKEELDGWANSVKAVAFAAVKKQPKKAKDNLGVWGFAAPITQNKNKGLWD